MDADTLMLETEERMEKALKSLDKDFSKLRTGRASTSLVEDLRIDYYGTPTPLQQISSISVPDSRTITIQPWDRNAFNDVEKGILKSDLGLTPVNDGKIIRISIPALTEERRKELVKVAKKYTEEAKVAVRNVRRDANEAFKKLKNDKEIGEDDMRKGQDDVQKLTDAHVAKADEALAAKEKEIMEI
ncbi:MAG: ribosome recycling factor [Desulfovibrionaceae bacterium]